LDPVLSLPLRFKQLNVHQKRCVWRELSKALALISKLRWAAKRSEATTLHASKILRDVKCCGRLLLALAGKETSATAIAGRLCAFLDNGVFLASEGCVVLLRAATHRKLNAITSIALQARGKAFEAEVVGVDAIDGFNGIATLDASASSRGAGWRGLHIEYLGGGVVLDFHANANNLLRWRAFANIRRDLAKGEGDGLRNTAIFAKEATSATGGNNKRAVTKIKVHRD
jgi:hypothetical protein